MAHKAVCHTLLKAFFELNEDIVQILSRVTIGIVAKQLYNGPKVQRLLCQYGDCVTGNIMKHDHFS